ncbi:MAG TPA: hypothetical protein ENH81_04600 [Thermococcus sp.]|nr:hypothetical protein [Thermococcus sp.]
MQPVVHPLAPEEAMKIFDAIEEYNVVSVDVQNAVSLLDDMIESEAKKLQYARRVLNNGNVDKAFFVVRGNEGILVIKMENVVEIRVSVGDYRRLIEDLSLNVG